MESGNAWFVIYHMYSTSNKFSARAVAEFEKDIKYAAEQLDVKYVIIEDYFNRMVWGEYANVWSAETFKAIIEKIHDYGAKVLPYTDATELSTTGIQYPKNGQKWGAKTTWGKVYSGFSSIMYPSVYCFPEYDWFGKIMCPGSGWIDFFHSQIKQLHENFEIDGIYLDRVDYRVKCYDHHKDPYHFEKGLPKLVAGLQKINKSYDSKNVLIVNDSCMKPDHITKQIFALTDGILSELLLADMNPYGIEQILSVFFGDMVWPFRFIVRPVLTYLLPRLYKTQIMTNKTRMQSIIKRINEASGGKDLYLFSHRHDKKSLEFLRSNMNSDKTHLCFYSGWKPLHKMGKID